MLDILIDSDFIKAASNLAAHALREICLSSFKIEYPSKRCPRLTRFFQILIERQQHGIQVNIMCNWNPQLNSVPRTNYRAAKILKDKGMDARYLPHNRCCHSKIITIDLNHLIAGSHNLSVASTTHNFEISLHTDHIPSVLLAYSHFKKHFNKAIKF